MPKAILAQEHCVDDKPDFDACKQKFRETTIQISKNFTEPIYDVWKWLKKRMNLVLKDGVVPSRQYNENKQRNYIISGASAVWDNSSQGLIGIVREYIPLILEQLPETKCKKCQNPIRIYTNNHRIVSNMWRQFWQIKAPNVNMIKAEKEDALLDLFRETRNKFMFVMGKECYSAENQVMDHYTREVFLPELAAKIDTVFTNSVVAYIEAVVNGLPDMVASKSFCVVCHEKVDYTKYI